jgi:DNA-binding response OmpR family regulator
MHWKFLSRQSSPVSGLIMAKLLETFTKKNNYEYDTAENGLLALQAFQNTQNYYDIVFMGKQILILNVAAF